MPTVHLDFAIIGAMKCGTTSLFDFVAAHPDVCAPTNKEPHYFTRGYRLPARYYERLFRGCEAGRLRGEASPTYAWVHRFPECPARLARDAPGVRLVLIVRDPLERALSQLRHQTLVGTRAADPVAAVGNPEIWERSSYRTTIEAYLEHFPRERLLVTDLAMLDRPERLTAFLAFLGLDPAPLEPLALPAVNVSAERRAVPGVVGRLASTPVGAVIRDLVPRERLHRLRRRIERDVDPGTRSEITRDDLRRIAPDRCAAVEAEYAWVRSEFLAD